MKKYIFVAIAAFLFAFAGNTDAQVRMRMGVNMRVPVQRVHRMPPTPEQRTEKQVQKLKHDLKLSHQQVIDVRDLFQQRDQARFNNDKAALKGLHFKDRMHGILTQDQFAQYMSMKQKQNPPPATSSATDEKQNPPPAKAQELDDVYN
ncbi:MAG: hypothetical protein ABI763_15950 [Bacteroidota bacterium]